MQTSLLTRNLDCCGQYMPQPICELKKELEGGACRVWITCDSRMIFENLRRFALYAGLKLESVSSGGGRYYMEVAQPL